MNYRVKIIETIAMTLEVEAVLKEEALALVKEKHFSEEITVEQNGRPEVNFIIE